MTHTDKSVIVIDGLTKRYGSHTVLDGLDLAIRPGVTALLGPNGAGKTTLIRILSTLVRPDGGAARVGGHDVVAAPAAVRARIGVTGQYAAVDEVLTGRENLELIGRLLGLRRKAADRATDLLARFDLEDAADRRTGTYSGGMRRRLDLAISLITSPPVVFLDEPTTGLDARSRLTLWDEVRRLAADGTTVLLTTQYLEEADAHAGRIVVLDGGRIVADDTPAALKARVGADHVDVLDDDGHVTRSIPTGGSAAEVAAVLAGLPPSSSVAVRRPTLDDVFLQLTGAPAAREEVSA